MLAKIQAVIATVKEYVLWIIGPVLVIGGALFYLFRKNESLQQDLATEKAKNQVEEDLDKTKELENEANNATADYESLRNEYLNDNKGGSSGTGNS